MIKSILETYNEARNNEKFIEYQNKDFYDVLKTLSKNYIYNFIIGGRGTGKTFSSLALLYNLSLTGSKFLYIRHRKNQIETIVNEYGNPFNAINDEYGTDIIANYSDKDGIGTFQDMSTNEVIGFASSITTVGKLRGFSLSSVDIIFWDEFILPPTDTKVSGEFTAFLDLYETVNRNRELKGLQPVIVIGMSNATKLNSPLLTGLGLMRTIENLINNNQSVYSDRKRSIRVEMLQDIPISIKKQDTALYRLVEGSSYYEHSLKNKFAFDNFSDVGKISNMNEYIPYISFLDMYIYRHKNYNGYYFSTIPFPPNCKAPHINADGNYKILKTNYINIYGRYLQGLCKFETYECKVKYLEAYNLT